MQNLGTYFNFSPPHCLFIMTLLLGSDEEQGVFAPETPNVKLEIERKFSKSRPKLGKFWRFWGSGGHVATQLDSFVASASAVCMYWAHRLRAHSASIVTYPPVADSCSVMYESHLTHVEVIMGGKFSRQYLTSTAT